MTPQVFSSPQIWILCSSVKHQEGTCNIFHTDVYVCPVQPSTSTGVFCNYSLPQSPSSLTPEVLLLWSKSSPHPLRNPLSAWEGQVTHHAQCGAIPEQATVDSGPHFHWAGYSVDSCLPVPLSSPEQQTVLTQEHASNSGSIVYCLCHLGEVTLPL